MLSWLFQAFQRQKKQGKAKKARVSRLFRGFRAFLGFFWQNMCAKNFCVSRILREKPGKYEIFFLGFPCFSRLFGYRILHFPRNRGILESWESIPGFSRFFKRKEKPGKRGIFIPGSPYFSGWYSMLSKKPWSPGKPGKLGIIPGFPRFFAHREKPGNSVLQKRRRPAFSPATHFRSAGYFYYTKPQKIVLVLILTLSEGAKRERQR